MSDWTTGLPELAPAPISGLVTANYEWAFRYM